MNDYIDLHPEGFSVVPVKYRKTSTAVRHLFVKEHKIREKEDAKPEGRTLFVINVSPTIDESGLKRLFLNCGEIENIILLPISQLKQKIDTSKSFFDQTDVYNFKVAYVIFKEPSSISRALTLNESFKEKPFILYPKAAKQLVGVELMKKDYNDNLIDVEELQAEINEYMIGYDERKEQEKLDAKNKGVADEEGWITVSRHGKRAYVPNNKSDEKILEKNAKRKKKQQKELQNFYSFQIRQSKMDHLTQLKKKFEEDKKRIAIMKATRKFKPF